MLLSIFIFILVIWLAGYAVGSLISQFSRISLGEKCLFAFPLGMGFTGWIEFQVNAFFHIPITASLVHVVLLSLATTGVVMLIHHIRTRHNFQHTDQNFSPSHSQIHHRWTPLVWLSLCILCLLLFRLVLEYWKTPHFHTDSYSSHFPFAKLVYQTENLPQFTSPSIKDMVFSYPPLQFMFFATTWIWLDSAHLFLPHNTGLIFGAHLFLLVYLGIRRIVQASPLAALGSIFCLLLPGLAITHLIINPAWGAHTDIPMAFWSVAAVYFLALDITDRKPHRWIWAGVCGALALWTKTNGLILGPVCLGVLGFEWIQARRDIDKTWPYAGIEMFKLFGIWGIIAMPLLLHNWIQWGNPVYPYMAQIFGGQYIDSWVIQRQTNHQIGLSMEGWYQPVFALLAEPVVAIGGLMILHPVIRQNQALRMLYLISIGFLCLFIVLVRVQIPLDYNRYLIVILPLCAILISILMDRQTAGSHLWTMGILVGGFLAQCIRIGFEFTSGMRQQILPVITNLNSLKVILIEWAPVLLIIVFLCTSLPGQRRIDRAIRTRVLWGSGCCLILTFVFPIAQPWRLLTDPFYRPSVDWTEVPLIEPSGAWMHANLPATSVILSDDERRWIFPRQIFPGDSPLLLPHIEDPEIPLEAVLERLAYLGVTHIFTPGQNGQPEPFPQIIYGLGRKPWDFLGYPDSDLYFKLAYHGPPVPFTQAPGSYTGAETFIYEIQYPPHLQEVLNTPAPRPWLYDYATMGVSLTP